MDCWVQPISSIADFRLREFRENALLCLEVCLKIEGGLDGKRITIDSYRPNRRKTLRPEGLSYRWRIDDLAAKREFFWLGKHEASGDADIMRG
jgi:hypothetical protein